MHPCTGTEALYRPYGITLLFLDHGTKRGWGVSVTPRPLFTPGKDLVPIVQEAGWAPRPVWTGAENLASTRIRSPDCPARSQSLYRLRYPAQRTLLILQNSYTVVRIRNINTLWGLRYGDRIHPPPALLQTCFCNILSIHDHLHCSEIQTKAKSVCTEEQRK